MLYYQLSAKVLNLEQELVLLKNKSLPKNPSPKQPKYHQQTQTLPTLTDTSCQTWDLSAMDIELQESSPSCMIRCNSLRKKIFYQSICEKTYEDRGNGDREGEESMSPQV